ncbi:transcriptional regulator, BadM/Rrf2 family [Paenibacillus sp. UNCCL117]|uniref:RrF2 family transcriptional regulator n=1 Tax=unclassified Paenibacillus TaxID=185978 RepID=UPI0008896217|nr:MULTISPECIES: Rrf2 family transcriptional regulator [unclassified Paenibacillus]SDE10675.1 Rrf2 family protein [Paenibacillus sp. cl123]SFW59822.1 transcriptional regulator, BadM/Rrf2 family [Paenibacillus sp. UNCCL117]
MQFSKSTGYALHALIHLARAERGSYVGIKELSGLLGVSVSYLSKVMSKLRQDGIVRAVTGASGGYELAKPADEITFLEVIQVVEGRQPLYECFEMSEQRHQLFYEAKTAELAPSQGLGGKECLVRQVMAGAERQMLQYLQRHTIQSVLEAASFDCGSKPEKPH